MPLYLCLCCKHVEASEYLINGLCENCNVYQRAQELKEVEETKKQLAMLESIISQRLTHPEAYYLFHLVRNDTASWGNSSDEIAKKQAILAKLESYL